MFTARSGQRQGHSKIQHKVSTTPSKQYKIIVSQDIERTIRESFDEELALALDLDDDVETESEKVGEGVKEGTSALSPV